MPSERYFIDQVFKVNQDIILKDSEFHHLVRVMRTRKGEVVELVNGQGGLTQATVEEIFKDQARLHIDSIHIEKRRNNKIILAQAIPKPNRLDYIIEKGTELGVDEFWLFPSQHSVKKDFSPEQLERLRIQIIAAMKQCGRLYLPELALKPSLEKWEANSGTFFFGDVDKTAELFSSAWKRLQVSFPVIFVVGPESGLSEKENTFLKEKGAYGVKLHENILRTDTAGIVALSLIEHWLLE